MSLTQQFFSRLSDKAQLALANQLLKYNVLYRLPLFKMFFNTLEAFGASREEMLGALEQANDFNHSFYEAWSDLGHDLLKQAKEAEAEGDHIVAKHKYLRATLYLLVADWPLERTDPIKPENYSLAMDTFEQFKRFHIPHIEKVEIPFKPGCIKANLRLPRYARKAAPAIVIFQGNDSVKEFMVRIEDIALEKGFATLSVDQPGFGESGMSGNLLNSYKIARTSTRSTIKYLTEHPKIDHDRIGAFGLSFGGFCSLYSAGLCRDVKAVATIGAPVHLRKVFKGLSFLMKQRTYQWSGCKNDKEVESMLKDMDIHNVIGKIKCPAFIIHGHEDEVVPRSEALSIMDTVRGEAKLELVEHGDHTCSLAMDELLPEIFDWFAEHFGMNN